MLYNSPHRHALSKRQQGFTLIELLMVIAVILILAGITFGISRGVQNAQARTKARAELATISQAIEQFKSRYGDYPWHDSNDSDYPKPSKPYHNEVPSVMLLYALTGRLVMERQTNGEIVIRKVADSLDNSNVKKNPKFLDHTKLSVSGSDSAPEALLDPWGNPYIYLYKWENTPGDWDVFGFHLYSTGPNGFDAHTAIKSEIPDKDTGVLNIDFRETANVEGIIFAGE